MYVISKMELVSATNIREKCVMQKGLIGLLHYSSCMCHQSLTYFGYFKKKKKKCRNCPVLKGYYPGEMTSFEIVSHTFIQEMQHIIKITKNIF